MKKNILSIILVLSIAILTLTGCKGGDEKEVERVATEYITNIADGDWESVIQQSTGDQLSIYVQLAPMLKEIQVDTKLQRLEVEEISMNKKGTIAFASVYRVANMSMESYGSTIDEKEILLSLKNIDGAWKVYRYDIIKDIQKNI